jgi:hypothetical protein
VQPPAVTAALPALENLAWTVRQVSVPERGQVRTW